MFARGHQLTGYAALLVHLDRIHGGVATCIAPFGDGLGERVLQTLQAVGQDVRKAHKQRQAQAFGAGAVDDGRQRQRRALGAARAHDDMSSSVHVHITVAPMRDGVSVAGSIDVPVLRHGGLLVQRACDTLIMSSQRRALTRLLGKSTKSAGRKPRTPRGRADLAARVTGRSLL
jgi:hypothetical protein